MKTKHNSRFFARRAVRIFRDLQKMRIYGIISTVSPLLRQNAKAVNDKRGKEKT